MTTVGRDPGNSLVVADQTVSRNHARLQVINGAATVEDVGSSSGTFVNDARITTPVLLKVGDVIRFGGAQFAYSPAASVSPMGITATMPARSGRKREVGSQEAAARAVPPPAAPVTNQGCMPDFSQFGRDLDGCMPLLLRLLIIFIVIVVVAGLIGGAVMLVASLGGAPGLMPGVGAPAGGGGGNGGGGGGAGGGPSPAGQQKPPPPPPQQQQQQQTQAANGSIRVIKVRTAYLAREGYAAPVPVALIAWQNVGSAPVVEVFADVTSFNAQGKVIGLQKAVRIYTGPAVPSNGTHEDTESNEGVILSLDQGQSSALDHATVSPTDVRIESTNGSTPEE